MPKCFKQCCNDRYNIHPSNIPWAEIIFYLIGVLHLIIAAVYIERISTEIGFLKSLTNFGRQFSLSNEYVIRTTALIASGVAVLITVSVIIGFVGAANGYERLLYLHCGILILSLMVELCGSVLVGFRAEYCQEKYPKLREVLIKYVNNYYADEQMKDYFHKTIDNEAREIVSCPVYRRWRNYSVIMDGIQSSFGCCGYDGYADYLNKASGVRGFMTLLSCHDLHKEATYELPSSCCQRNFQNNLFCSARLATNHSLLTEQIFTEGCAIKIIEYCEELAQAAGPGSFFLVFVHAVILICSIPTIVIQVQIIRTMERLDVQYYHYHNESYGTLTLVDEHGVRKETGRRYTTLLHQFQEVVTQLKKSHLKKVKRKTWPEAMKQPRKSQPSKKTVNFAEASHEVNQ